MSLVERLRNQPAVVGPPTAAAPAPAPAAPPPAPAPEPAPPADGAVLSSSEISAQLSDLLLKGWRMLEEECPVTAACPLMLEKKTGRKFSVALQKCLKAQVRDAPHAAIATRLRSARVLDARVCGVCRKRRRRR